MTYAEGEIIKVQLIFEDGTVKTLLGNEAIKWGQVVAAQGTFCSIHTAAPKCPEFPWKVEKP